MRDPVITYFDYDGELELPEEGVAICDGSPHYFWLREPLPEPGSAIFDIAPIAKSLLALVSEYESIWRDWDRAYHSGEVELSTHPIVEGNNPRFVELSKHISAQAAELHKMARPRPGVVELSGRFLALSREHAGKRWPIPGFTSAELEITWHVPDAA